MIYEPETHQFWEKLHRENAREKLKDKLHYRKKEVILQKLSLLYCERMKEI